MNTFKEEKQRLFDRNTTFISFTVMTKILSLRIMIDSYVCFGSKYSTPFSIATDKFQIK